MEATSLCSSILPPLPFSTQPKKMGFCILKRSNNGKVLAGGRESYEHDYRGRRHVDESMIVLRKRIHEMKVIERNYEPPAEWMEWEKQYFVRYGDIVCSLVGLLQSQLMSTRPCLALGMLGLVIMGFPVSTVVIFSHLMETANGVLSAVHLG